MTKEHENYADLDALIPDDFPIKLDGRYLVIPGKIRMEYVLESQKIQKESQDNPEQLDDFAKVIAFARKVLKDANPEVDLSKVEIIPAQALFVYGKVLEHIYSIREDTDGLFPFQEKEEVKPNRASRRQSERSKKD